MRGQVSPILSAYGNVDRDLIIPVYQRNYDWRIKQCEQLLVDLEHLILTDQPKHFFGALVGKPDDSFTWVVIDGQQRLTTVSLLMLAIVHTIRDSGEGDSGLARRIQRNYLLSGDSTDNPRFRLKPVKHDAEAYRRLYGPEDEFIETSNLTANYRYFMKRIPELEVTPQQLWGGIERLEVMILDLEAHDDAQRIFESLNSTGLALSEADKVRNFVLMGLPVHEQTVVYEDYWNRIEQNVEYDTTAFLRWYLTAKTTRIPTISAVYDEFKRYARDQGAVGRELLAPIREYADIYRQIRRADTASDAVNHRLQRYNILRAEVVLPFLLPTFSDWRHGRISEHDVVESLRIIESYLFRRWACSIPTHALNKIFATAYRELTRLKGDSDSFVDVLAYLLRRRTRTGTFPADAAFTEALRTRDFYKTKREWRNYLFECLENLNSRDSRDIVKRLEDGELSVEHIMPQTLTDSWRRDLGAEADVIHENWLHRLGNLTVTGYNSKYSNVSFKKKQSIENGFLDSPYRLNRELKTAEVWDLDAMEARTDRLVNDALKYWRYPETSFEPPAPQLPVETLGGDTNFTNRVIVAFEFNEVQGTVASWTEFAQVLMKELLRIDRERVLAFAQKFVEFHVGSEPNMGRKLTKIDNGFYWNLQTSTREKVLTLRRLFEYLDLDAEDVLVTLRPTESENASERQEEEAKSTYALLIKFKERLETRRGASEIDEEAQQILAEFTGEVMKFGIEDPMGVLGSTPMEFAGDPERVTAASEQELLALISGVVALDKVFPGSLWRQVANGNLVDWLGRLAEKS
ncbi:Uncharacterized conserved protein, contains ParB-like and HNH nuclease domains [Bowdeniella nasicola]|uniref:Uncharacterized conserved protein, contains ParB-like and HNH nuclease domains n=1 Tax=Bowdeniella nasicola TaxID=208480 RepID=A0A1H4B4J8_9ACTO|nr:DUF262 domain-containing protein [Bowdeniella nasicola]SEA43145.1 Uncharacterized conserved protein, contains ParB-like and HNH nuclease domains [Bowdeniella nasicola]